jgi:putative ABC transport system substrate-binding protein
VFDFALEHKVPAIYEQDFMARDGGLMSYGADARESFDHRTTSAACPLADPQRTFAGI